jgi:hypothetical protein
MNSINNKQDNDNAACNKTALKTNTFRAKCSALISRKKKNRIAISDAASYATCQNMWHKRVAQETNVTIVAKGFLGNDVCYTPQSIVTQRYHKGRVDEDPVMDFNQYTQNGVFTSYSVNIEREFFKNINKWKLQSATYETRNDVFIHFVKKHLLKLGANNDAIESINWLTDQLDHVSTLAYWYQKCQTSEDFYRLTILGYRLFTTRMAARDVLTKIYGIMSPQVQGDKFSDFLELLRGGFDVVNTTTNSEMFQKVSNLYTFLLVQGFLTKFGITLNDRDYTRLEMKAMECKTSRTQMWMSVIDTTLFICERINDFRLTGDVSRFLHSGDEYSEWMKEVDRVVALAPFSANLKPHGTTYFTYVSDINDLYERGEAYAKYTKVRSGGDNALLQRKLATIRLLKNTEITRRASQKERTQPFGVLIHGTSSVAKSTFSKMLYYYYGRLHGLECDDHYRYVRNPADEYWSNFDSSKWCIQMDDIAFLLPNKASDADPTLMEMLNVINNVPYVPPQAALEDKGKTPVLAKVVIATTNASDLNAHEYFWCPLAVRRRLPFVVHVEPKKEYIHENGRFINPSSLPPIDGAFPDFWRITVQKVVPLFDGQRDRAVLETVKIFENSAEFLKFYGEASRAHENVQAKSMHCDEGMSNLQVCPLCLLVSRDCECAVQAAYNATWGEYFLNTFYEFFVSVCMGFLTLKYVINFHMYVARFRLFRKFLVQHVWRYYPQDIQMRLLGHMNDLRVDNHKWRALLICLGMFASGAAVYFASNFRKKDEDEKIVSPTEIQGNIHGTTEGDIPQEESQNVWYNPTLELTKFDVPTASQSLVGIDSSRARELFGRNCVRLEIHNKISGKKLGIGAVFVRGHFCLVNNHAFSEKDADYEVTIIQSTLSQGVTNNMTVRVMARDIVRIIDQDLCLIEFRSLPPFKDITKFWTKDFIPVTKAFVVRRLANGDCETQDIYNMSASEQFPIEALGISPRVYCGVGPRDTKAGDCGGLAIADTPRGPVILGIHTLGYGVQCGFLYVSNDALENLINNQKRITGLKVEVQGGGAPLLECGIYSKVLTEPHHKSVVRYLETGVANIYGSFAGFRPKPKSRVCETPMADIMCDHFDYKIKYGAPVMSGWEPWRKNIVQMVKPNVTHDRVVLQHCVHQFAKDILEGLPQDWEKELIFLSTRASINGLPGVKFVDRLNVSTSMGFPWACSKKKFLHTDPDEFYPEGVSFSPEILERVDIILGKYAKGERAYPVYTGHLKDEATSFTKIENKKTRLFTGAPVDWSLVVRSRLLTFVRLVQKNKFVFEAGPGTVCQSTEWGQVHDYLTEFGADRIIAGDYAWFDKTMIADFILAAFQVIAHIYEAAGFEPDEVREIMCIGEDVAFPVVSVNADLIEFFGTNPSGHPLTVIINSIVNSLYMRYCYTMLNPKFTCVSFKSNVHLFTYGDDNIMGVSVRADWFNHTAVQSVLLKIGVTYTMADKESESVPYISIGECQFLKRKWRYDEDVNAWLCPLEEQSIHKSLTTWVPSKTIDKYAQMVAVISSANSEYFFYGKEIFEHHHRFFRNVLTQEPFDKYVTDTTLPGWDDLVDRFWRASKDVSPTQVGSWPISPVEHRSQKSNNNDNKESVEVVTGSTTTCLMGKDIPFEHFSKNPQYFELQSATFEEAESVITSEAIGSSTTVEQTVTFIDNEGGVCVDAPSSTNNVALVDGTEDIGLGSFLSRPTLIRSITWTTSSPITILDTIKPWHLFLNNTQIKKKIDNYAFLRGNLHIKVILNGTPFQYGMMRMCYSPLLGFVGDKIIPTFPINPTLVPYSQQPGFYLYPQANAGGEMKLPFFLHKNWLDITSANEVENMGTLNFVVYNPLKTAVTGGTTAVTVRIYAWMSDVQLMGPTSKLVLQADEYGTGVVSAPASALASIAQSLTHVPIIGRFARATEIGASAVSKIATLFGFTNVPVISDVHGYQPMNGPMLASAHIGTQVQKLALDPKQELSIDPSPHGIGSADELSLSYLKTKESYFSATSWSTTDLDGTQLWNMRVNPFQATSVDVKNTLSVNVGKQTQHVPLSYIGSMFKHWRGDLILRVKVVCTKFHKGRLKISYDPRGDITTTDPAENAVYTEILDIGERDDVEIRIPYHQDLPWLKIDQTIEDNWSEGNALAPRLGIDNGILTVRVLTGLTAPVSGSINLNFFIRGAENFEFANPAGHIGPDGTNVVPSFFELQAEDHTDVVSSQLVMGTPAKTGIERYALNYGECVGSLRNILHRYTIMDTVATEASTTGAGLLLYRKLFKRMPYTPGFQTSWPVSGANIVASAGTNPYAYNTMHPMPWVSGMFLGYRGGINVNATVHSDKYGFVDDIKVVRTTDTEENTTDNRYFSLADSISTTATLSSKSNFLGRRTQYRDGLAGVAITSNKTNASVSFNLPDFNNRNFSLVDPSYYALGSSVDGTDEQGAILDVQFRSLDNATDNGTRNVTVQSAVGAGVDFTCLYFLCCPTVFYQTARPAYV